MTNEKFFELYPTTNDQINYYVRKVMGCLEHFEIDGEYSEKGVRENVETWYENSERKFEILRKSPLWHEEAKAIIFLTDVGRDIDTDTYYEEMNKLILFSESFVDSSYEQGSLMRYLRDSHPQKTISDEFAECIKFRYGNHFSYCSSLKGGTKLSRFIQKVFKNYECAGGSVVDITDATKFKKEIENWVTINGEETKQIRTTSFNTIFAKVADSVNPLKIKRITILSANILDWLTMSNGNSWASCHYINSNGLYHSGQSHYSGCYKAGTLSYALDENSFIFYTLPSEYKGDEWWKEQKITRQVFGYRNDILLQSRLYPQSHDGDSDGMRETREIVQKIFSDCEEKPNFWNAPTSENVRKYVRTGDGALQYEDYFCYPVKISVRKSDFPVNDDEIEPMEIGHVPYCVNCGEEITNAESLQCDDCNDESEYCEHCGDRHPTNEMYWDENREAWFCSDCVSYCEYHERYEFTDDVSYEVRSRNRFGGWNTYYVCEDAIEWGGYGYCEDCGYYYENESIVECLDGEYRCVECAEEWESDHCVVCEDCGELILREDAIEGADGRYRCETCNDEYAGSSSNESEEEIKNSENDNPKNSDGNTWAMRCVNNRWNTQSYTAGKIYNVVDGSFITDTGSTLSGSQLRDFQTWADFSSSEWELVS